VDERFKASAALIASCIAIFWPGAFIFSFAGIMGPYWQMTFAGGRADIGRTLFFILAAVGISMFLIGRWQEKIGPARLVAAGGLLCGISTLSLGYASTINQVYLWAFVVGTSSAFIYIPALTTVQRWYPHRRGLVSGLVNMAFGLSAALMAPIFSWMLDLLGPVEMTMIFGIIALIVGMLAASWVRFPQSAVSFESADANIIQKTKGSLTVSQSLRTKTFWLLWLTWALTGAAGISMVSLSTSFGLSKGLSMPDAVLILTAFNLTNGLSRLVSGYLSDVIGRNITMALAFLAAGCAYILIPLVAHLFAWALLAAVVGFAFGTLFAVSAPLASDCFGMQHFGAILGLVFTAYGFVSGSLGPWLSGHLLDTTGGNFILVFSYLGIFCLVSSVLIWFTRPPRIRL
jgi:OFA family oxalate/formate antiporter-like MFS transporter